MDNTEKLESIPISLNKLDAKLTLLVNLRMAIAENQNQKAYDLVNTLIAMVAVEDNKLTPDEKEALVGVKIRQMPQCGTAQGNPLPVDVLVQIRGMKIPLRLNIDGPRMEILIAGDSEEPPISLLVQAQYPPCYGKTK